MEAVSMTCFDWLIIECLILLGNLLDRLDRLHRRARRTQPRPRRGRVVLNREALALPRRYVAIDAQKGLPATGGITSQ